MTKLLIVSDDGVPSGYGRISMEVNMRLARRGYTIMVASYGYDGLLQAQFDGAPLPYHVASLAGKDYAQAVRGLVDVWQPDIIISTQDFPYAQTIRYNTGIDWSKYGFIIMTPVDGVPIYPPWLETMREADAGLTISAFGVEAFRNEGIPVSLCRPGINANRFFRYSADRRADIRAKLGIAPDAFLVGTMAQNQGRKCISLMLKAFFEFAKDKPSARYLLDMEKVSPAGWDIPSLCKQFKWDESKLLYREECNRRGVMDIAERYNALDAHMVIAHREGYGLPLAEAMACGVVSIALDYCSGTEICGDNKGVLIPAIDYAEPGTWGGAEDRFADLRVLVSKLQWLHDQPLERAALAERGMAWSRQQTWDNAADAVQQVVDKVMEKRRTIPAASTPFTQLVLQEAAG